MAAKTTALPMLGARSRGPLNDSSGTIAAGGTAQPVFPYNANRNYLFIQNQSSGALWVDFGEDAVESWPSIRVDPGDNLEYTIFVPTGGVSIVGGTNGQAYVAKEG